MWVNEFDGADDEPADARSSLENAIDLVGLLRDTLIATATAYNSGYEPNRRKFASQQRQLTGILRRHGIRQWFPWEQVDEGVAAAKNESRSYHDIRVFFRDRADKTITALQHRIDDQACGDLTAGMETVLADADGAADLAAVRRQIARMEAALPTDPSSALSEAKNLIEVVAKIVLAELGDEVLTDRDLGKLALQAASALGIDRKSVAEHDQDIAQIMARLQGLVHDLGSLRNHAGDGHGVLDVPEGLDLRHGRLAVRAAIAWSAFALDTLHDRRAELGLD